MAYIFTWDALVKRPGLDNDIKRPIFFVDNSPLHNRRFLVQPTIDAIPSSTGGGGGGGVAPVLFIFVRFPPRRRPFFMINFLD